MKKLILIIVFLTSGIWSLSAQNLPLALQMDLKTIVKFEQKDTVGGKAGSLCLEVKGYDVKKTATGQYYIEYINSKQVKTRKYLGYTNSLDYRYEGNSVFFSADTTKAWMFTIDRYGQIFKMDLPDWFATETKILLKQMALPE
jgi:hypothetical protein